MKKSNQPKQQFYILSRTELENIVVSSVRLVFSETREAQELLQKTYTRKEAASFLKVTPQTVSKYVHNRKLSAIMAGRKMIFMHQELEKHKNSKSQVRWKM